MMNNDEEKSTLATKSSTVNNDEEEKEKKNYICNRRTRELFNFLFPILFVSFVLGFSMFYSVVLYLYLNLWPYFVRGGGGGDGSFDPYALFLSILYSIFLILFVTVKYKASKYIYTTDDPKTYEWKV